MSRDLFWQVALAVGLGLHPPQDGSSLFLLAHLSVVPAQPGGQQHPLTAAIVGIGPVAIPPPPGRWRMATTRATIIWPGTVVAA